ncbi:MAG TPA: SRPBCC domain-containing protein [Anaerolineaceae bacterium]|jgi:uncharacterized protein YndB with AHSA1/START domain
MTEKKAISNNTKDGESSELVIERIFDAPQALVWKMWKKPEHLMRWWVPKGFSIKVVTMDFSPGGIFLYGLQSSDRNYVWGKFVYREIVPSERIVFISSFTDEEGHLARNPMSPTWPREVLNTLTLDEHDGKTTLILRGGPHKATETERKTFEDAQAGVRMGFSKTFDQLAGYLVTL